MNGVAKGSVSAGSSQRAASVTCRPYRVSPAAARPTAGNSTTTSAAASRTLMTCLMRLASVEDLVAEIAQPQRGVVGSPLGRLGHAGLDDAADEDGMVRLFDRRLKRALDERRRVGQDRRSRRATTKRLTGNGGARELGWLEEGEGHGLLALAEHVEREGLRLLDERVRVRVRFHADDDQ